LDLDAFLLKLVSRSHEDQHNINNGPWSCDLNATFSKKLNIDYNPIPITHPPTALYQRDGTTYSATFKFLNGVDLRLMHLALYAPRKKQRDKLDLIFKLGRIVHTNRNILITYIDFLFIFVFLLFFIDFSFFIIILDYSIFILFLKKYYLLSGNWNYFCEVWRPFEKLMMSWVALSRIPNGSHLSTNSRTFCMPTTLAKESFWIISTFSWGSTFARFESFDCGLLELSRLYELAVFGRVLVIVFFFFAFDG
jgi:hypothetical protein